MARIDDRWAEHRQELVDAAHAAGIDSGVMVKIAEFESGFNPAARPVAISHPENNTVKQCDGVSAYGVDAITKNLARQFTRMECLTLEAGKLVEHRAGAQTLFSLAAHLLHWTRLPMNTYARACSGSVTPLR